MRGRGVGKGGFAVLDRAVAHELEALEDSAFLLTFTWPEQDRGLDV